MRCLLIGFIFLINNYIIAIRISDFELNNIKNLEDVSKPVHNSSRSQWCYNNGGLVNASVFCNNLIKDRSESKVFDGSNDKYMQNSLMNGLFIRPTGTINQISLQDQTLRDALNRFGSNYFLSIQPIAGLDMSLGTNQLKLNYKY